MPLPRITDQPAHLRGAPLRSGVRELRDGVNARLIGHERNQYFLVSATDPNRSFSIEAPKSFKENYILSHV